MSQQMKAIEINRSPPVTPLEAQSAFGLNIKIPSLSPSRKGAEESKNLGLAQPVTVYLK
jgi:hypothetical protein